MKKIKVLLLVMLVIFTSGCGNRNPITGDAFYERTNKDYDVLDIKREYYDFADTAYRLKSDDNLQIIFIDTSVVNAKNIYIDETNNVYGEASKDLLLQNKDNSKYELKESDVDDAITTGNDYSIVEVSTSKKYYRITWIEDTVMIGQVDVAKKTTLLKLMKKLGY